MRTWYTCVSTSACMNARVLACMARRSARPRQHLRMDASWSSGGELDIEIEFVTRLRASCTRVLNPRILTQTHAGGLEASYGRLFRWDRLCRNDILSPELGVIRKGLIKVEPDPSLSIAVSRDALKEHYRGRRGGRIRANLIYKWMLSDRFTTFRFFFIIRHSYLRIG